MTGLADQFLEEIRCELIRQGVQKDLFDYIDDRVKQIIDDRIMHCQQDIYEHLREDLDSLRAEMVKALKAKADSHE